MRAGRIDPTIWQQKLHTTHILPYTRVRGLLAVPRVRRLLVVPRLCRLLAVPRLRRLLAVTARMGESILWLRNAGSGAVVHTASCRNSRQGRFPLPACCSHML